MGSGLATGRVRPDHRKRPKAPPQARRLAPRQYALHTTLAAANLIRPTPTAASSRRPRSTSCRSSPHPGQRHSELEDAALHVRHARAACSAPRKREELSGPISTRASRANGTPRLDQHIGLMAYDLYALGIMNLRHRSPSSTAAPLHDLPSKEWPAATSRYAVKEGSSKPCFAVLARPDARQCSTNDVITNVL